MPKELDKEEPHEIVLETDKTILKIKIEESLFVLIKILISKHEWGSLSYIINKILKECGVRIVDNDCDAPKDLTVKKLQEAVEKATAEISKMKEKIRNRRKGKE